MSEKQQADRLAAWLAKGPGTPAPPELDSDVVEVVYALHPFYAPRLQLTAEDVLESISDGPLLDPAVGKALEDWVNSEPGTPPPDALPKGVVEATYALRPQLAPRPQLGIDDILDSVESGPFIRDHNRDVTSSTAARAWWKRPALGVMAVAAAALFFVRPVAHNAAQPPQDVPVQFDAASTAQATEVGRAEVSVSLQTEPATPTNEIIPTTQTAGSPQPSTIDGKKIPPPTSTLRSRPKPSTRMAPPPTAKPAENNVRSVDALAGEAGPIAFSVPAPQAAVSRSASAPSTMEENGADAAPIEPAKTVSRRGNQQLATFDKQIEEAIAAEQYAQALELISRALNLSKLTRFDSARLWRTKARILTDLGRDAEAQKAQRTAAALDPAR